MIEYNSKDRKVLVFSEPPCLNGFINLFLGYYGLLRYLWILTSQLFVDVTFGHQMKCHISTSAYKVGKA